MEHCAAVDFAVHMAAMNFVELVKSFAIEKHCRDHCWEQSYLLHMDLNGMGFLLLPQFVFDMRLNCEIQPFCALINEPLCTKHNPSE